MGLDVRKSLGGLAEAALNDAVDKLFDGDSDVFDQVAVKLAAELRKLLGDNIKEKLKANIIDKIDGEDDIPNV